MMSERCLANGTTVLTINILTTGSLLNKDRDGQLGFSEFVLMVASR